MFKPVSTKVTLPQLEEELIRYWKENNIFEKSIDSRPENKKWTFLDGPPFITGMPHYGTLLSSIPKDVFGRYWTMKGYRVRRVWGWDCHGLPAENKVETKLGLKSKREIVEKIGVKTFIDECKLYVSQVSSEWGWYIDHIARWVDFTHAYKTMDIDYMETVMWVFKTMYDKGFVYKGLRVSLYCPHCSTPISNFEVAMDADNYKEIMDAATTYKYELANEKGTYILAWSTTPWNKIVTPALAINPNLTYVKVAQGKEKYILAKSTLKILKENLTPTPLLKGEGVSVSSPLPLGEGPGEGSYEIIEEFNGKELMGKKFIPHYDYYPIEPDEKAFEIIGGDFVTAEEGTGVVTIAAYGEEDLKAMKENNIHIEMHVDDEGTIKSDVPVFGGMYYLKANKFVNEDLAKRGLVYKDEQLPHNVPLCWRCHTRLYYAPQDAWYVDVQKLKKQMESTNELVHWFPPHFKYGRFLKSLQAAPDWCISRSRFWGSPVPVWECECGERIVPSSIKELEELSGKKITDLHKPEIDEITIPCSICGKLAKRVPEVLDSWIEAGSASFAERHYPFNKGEKLEDFFPPDFIVEYTGQIRAWFYVLHVIANALHLKKDKLNILSKNVLVTGVILGTDGRKMSKNFGNYPDPKEMLQRYGGDALRLYLLSSPVMRGEDILISEEQYRNQVRGMLLILWNIYNFFVMNANVDGWERKVKSQNSKVKNILDQWILVLLETVTKEVTDFMEQYDTVGAIEVVKKFIDDFSTWYIRRSRDRVGTVAENQEDKKSFYEVTYYVLTTLCKLLAPLTPFMADEIYRNLTNEESVHLSEWPSKNQEFPAGQAKIPTSQKLRGTSKNQGLIEEMVHVRKIVEMGLAQRKEHQIKVRQPLAKLTIYPGKKEEKFSSSLDYLILDELNVKKIEFKKDKLEETRVELDIIISPELKAEGQAREIARSIQEERKKLGTTRTEKVNVILPEWPKEFEAYIKNKALVQSLTQGEEFRVSRV